MPSIMAFFKVAQKRPCWSNEDALSWYSTVYSKPQQSGEPETANATLEIQEETADFQT
jgi:hypothetical protein